MRRLFLPIAMLALTGTLIAQTPAPSVPPSATPERPDFSGTWSVTGRSMTIRQDGSTMTVTRDSEIRTYNLDGAETRFTIGSAQITARTRWVTSALVVELQWVSPIGSWQDLEVYSVDYSRHLSVVRVNAAKTQPLMHTNTDVYARTGPVSNSRH